MFVWYDRSLFFASCSFFSIKIGVGVSYFLLSNRMLQNVFVFEMFNCYLFNLKHVHHGPTCCSPVGGSHLTHLITRTIICDSFVCFINR